jgi:glycosyltransferase involved in cell wall biosynthesis
VSKPEVSVIMPVYNAAPYLREAIDSIVAQTFQSWELILLNDGSTDDSLQIAQSYTDSRFKILDSEKNHGLIYQLNRGMEAAQGRYIARLDADDIALPGRLQRQFDYLEQHPETGLLGGFARVIGTDEIMQHSTNREEIVIELLYRNAFIHSTVMFRKSVYMSVSGGFKEDYKHAEDYHMWQLFALHTGVANLTEVLIQYRMHEQQVSRVHAAGLETSANKVRLEYVAAALKTELTESEQRTHLLLVHGAERDIPPAQVKKWVDVFVKKNTFFPAEDLVRYLDSRLKTYVRGYFLWNKWCGSPWQFLKQWYLIKDHLTLREIISVLKVLFTINRQAQSAY